MEHERIAPNSSHQGFLENMRIMNEIVREMKEIPELPSEVSKDSHPLTEVEFTEDGSVLTYMAGYEYPYRGFPFFEIVDRMDLVKKIIRQTQSSFYHALKNKNKLKLAGLIGMIPVARSFIWAYCYVFDRIFERFRCKPQRMSKAVKEIYRASSVPQMGENKEIEELRIMLRNIECMILEFDNAYRFRIQDIFMEINKIALQKNPIKELNRIINIWIERELVETVKDTWRLLKMFINYYLRFDRKFLRMIVNILCAINPEEIKLQIEDKYFAAPREDYIFGFQRNPTKEDKMLIKKANYDKEFGREKEQILKQNDLENKELMEKHKIEQEQSFKGVSEEQKKQKNEEFLKQKDQLTVEYNQNIMKLLDSFLTDEQKQIKQRHIQQRIELDNKFSSQLKERDEHYAQLKKEIYGGTA